MIEETNVLSQTLISVKDVGSITVRDVFHLLGYLTTIAILLLPINDCDRRDPIGAITYATFICISASILIFAVPNLDMENRIIEQIIVYFGFGYIAIMRWDKTFFEYLLTKERIKIKVNENAPEKSKRREQRRK